MAEASLMALLEAMLSLAARPAILRRPTTNVKAGGYSDDIFLDLSEDDLDEYRCSICYLVLKDVMECRNKHRFCFTCIQVWSTTGEYLNRIRCPVCRCEGHYSKNQDLDEVITMNRVKCTMKGCTWKGLLKYCDTHKHSNYQAPSTSSSTLPPLKSAAPKTPRSRPANQSSSSSVRSNPTHDPNNNVSRGTSVSFRRGPDVGLVSPDNEQTEDEDPEPVSPLSPILPVPPRTPRYNAVNRRRLPTLPSPISPIPPAVAPASTSVARGNTGLLSRRRASQNLTPARLSEPSARSTTETNGERLTTVHNRLVESRNRLEGLMMNFSDGNGESEPETYTFQEERENNNRQQLQEVQELGRRLGQVAAELRQLLSYRRNRTHDSDSD